MLGHKVSIVGTSESFVAQNYPGIIARKISAHGTGALYSRIRFKESDVLAVIEEVKPDIIFLEGWQTGVSEAFIDVLGSSRIPLVLISHGISLHPYTFELKYFFRWIAWIPYTLKLQRRLRNLKLLSAISLNANSWRFYDRDCAAKVGVPVMLLRNSPYFSKKEFDVFSRESRQLKVIHVGYFSDVKNQKLLINVFSYLSKNLNLTLIGDRKGTYYQECRSLVSKLGLTDRVRFAEDREVDIQHEISTAVLVCLPSKTEIKPLVLLEAMAAGTPFICFNVGANNELRGGVTVPYGVHHFVKQTKLLIEDDKYWNQLSIEGYADYCDNYRSEHQYCDLEKILKNVLG